MSVADINPVSKGMTDASFVVSDGLHPSAKEYILWEEVIYPVAEKVLKE